MGHTIAIWFFGLFAAAIIGGFLGSAFDAMSNPYSVGVGVPFAQMEYSRLAGFNINVADTGIWAAVFKSRVPGILISHHVR